MEPIEDQGYEEALAALAGKGSLQRDALLLSRVEMINGKVRFHDRWLFGDPDDADDHGWAPEIRANTQMRKNLTFGSKVVRVMLPPALAGGIVAIVRAVADAIAALN